MALQVIGCSYDYYSSSPKLIDSCSASVSSPPGRSKATRSGQANEKDIGPSSHLKDDFCLGMQAFYAKNFPIAKSHLLKAKGQTLGLEDYVIYYLACSYEEMGDHRQAITLFLNLKEQFSQSRFAKLVELKAADNFFFLGDYQSARQYYKEVLEKGSKEKEYIHFQIAVSLIEEKELLRARESFKKMLVFFPAGKYAEPSSSYLKEIESKLQLEPLIFNEDDELEIIRSFMEERQYGKALDHINQVINRPSTPKFLSEFLYKEAFCYAKLGEKELALQKISPLVKRYPSSLIALESLYLAGNILWNLNQDGRAIEIYQEIIRTFRPELEVDKAWYLMGRIYEQNQKYNQALQCFQRIVDKFPQSKNFPDSLWRIGWIYYQSGKFFEAIKHFELSLTKIKDDQEKHLFLYWQARAAEKCNNPSEALHLYETIVSDSYYSYYSWWASQKLNTHLLPPLKSFQIKKDSAEDSSTKEISLLLNRVRKLLDYRLFREAIAEISLLANREEKAPHYWYTLGKMALEVKSYRQAIKAGNQCRQQLLKQEGQENYKEICQLIYPLAYWDYIQEYATKHDLDPFFVCALMRQESLFDPLSLSSAQAYGLMQIIPKTARIIASKTTSVKADDFKETDLYQPELNIAFGSWYLSDLQKRYQGNVVYMLSAYNAGEIALERWCNRYGNLPLDEFVENISYKETRNYVKKVLQNYGIYLRVYNTISNSNVSVSENRDMPRLKIN